MTSASGLPIVNCVVITKNEEHNLPDCLQSVHCVDEGAVIDAESSAVRQIWGSEMGRKKETGAIARKLVLLTFKLRPSWKTSTRKLGHWK